MILLEFGRVLRGLDFLRNLEVLVFLCWFRVLFYDVLWHSMVTLLGSFEKRESVGFFLESLG